MPVNSQRGLFHKLTKSLFSGLKYSVNLFGEAGRNFVEDSCFRSSAALSFYSLISIAPLVLITIEVGGLFVDSTSVRDEVIEVFRNLIGDRGADGVFILMDSLLLEDSGVLPISFGVLLLIFSATTILVQVKNGFNEVFGIAPLEGKKGFLKQFFDRLVSIGLIISLGFALIISLTLDTVIVTLVGMISARFETLSLILLQVLQNLLALMLVYIVIFSMYRYLTDVQIRRRYLLSSALVTTIVLLIGKFFIGWYIGHSNLAELSGGASSVIILMLWVYYSSLIIFFGAELIKAQADFANYDYLPGKYSKRVKLIEVDVDDN